MHEITHLNASRFRAATGLPQLVTEFGNIDDPVELDRTLHRYDDEFNGWFYWAFHGGDKAERLTANQRSRLVRTYPRATAGEPISLTFDPESGEMRYSYRPKPLGVPTEIAVSDVHYPNGYVVTVTGATATSPPGAEVVTLDGLPKARRVDVVIRRR